MTFSFSGYFLLGLTWVGSLRWRSLCESPNAPWMVDDVDWSSVFKQEMIRKHWSKTRLGNLNEKPCLLQLKIELLRHCSRGDIYSSLCFLYLLIIFSTFSIVTPTLEYIISSGKLVWTEWKFSMLICYSQVNRLEVRCIWFLLLLHEVSSLPEVWHWNFLQHSVKVFFHVQVWGTCLD